MTAQTMFDEQLIMQIAGGDRQAFASVYEATKSSVYGFALSIVKNRADAEDIMHDAYLKLYSSAASYKPQGKPMAFILTIVKHLAYNRIRDGRHTAQLPEENETMQDKIEYRENQTVGIDQQVENKMLLDIALGVLDETERQIVTLHAMTGMKHREIADLLEISLSTVLSKYHRSLDKMKKELENKGVQS